MTGCRIVTGLSACCAGLCVAGAGEWFSPGVVGAGELFATLIPGALAAFLRPRLDMFSGLVGGYAGGLALLHPNLAVLPLAVWFVSAVVGVTGLFWILRTLICSGGWASVTEAGKVVFAVTGLFFASPLLVFLFSGTELQDGLPWTVRPILPGVDGLLVAILLPVLLGVPAGMGIMGLRRGRLLVLGALAFLAFFPLGEALPQTERSWRVLVASTAMMMLAGSLLVGRFSPRMLDAARLAGASRLDIMSRLYLRASGWKLLWLFLAATVFAFDLRELPAANPWASFFRILFSGLLLLYFGGLLPVHPVAGRGTKPDRRSE